MQWHELLMDTLLIDDSFPFLYLYTIYDAKLLYFHPFYTLYW